ncbi:MAG: hypothetical protein AAFU38_20450, partial [Bacteroidota bacterium]
MRALRSLLAPSLCLLLFGGVLAVPLQAQVLTSLYSARSPNSQNDGFFGSVVVAAGDVDDD